MQTRINDILNLSPKGYRPNKNTCHLLSVKDCKGITLETESNEWTLRASEELTNSTKNEISKLRTCFTGIMYTLAKYSKV